MQKSRLVRKGEFDPYIYIEREGERRRALAEFAKRLKETPVGSYLHFKDERISSLGITVLPVFRYEDGRYYVNYYLRYGTEKPLEQLTPSDILYIDKRLPRSAHWAILGRYYSYLTSSVARKVSRAYLLSVSLREATRRHYWAMAKRRRPLVNMYTLHALLSFYVSTRARLGTSMREKVAYRYVHNPYKFAVNKLRMSPAVFRRLTTEPFSLDAPGSTHLIEASMSLAKALNVTPDALVGYPILLLVHPTNRNVTIVLPHRTYYPITPEKMMAVLGNQLDEAGREQVREVVSTFKKIISSVNIHLEERKMKMGYIRRLHSDYIYVRKVMQATMHKVERARYKLMRRQRVIRDKEAIARFMKIFSPTGEIDPSVKKALENEERIKERLKQTGEKRAGVRMHGFRSVYDYEI